MARLRLTISGADFSAVGIGKSSAIPNPRGLLYGAYLLGSEYGASSGYDARHDWSGNGRDLALTGSIGSVGTLSTVTSGSLYFATPFTGAALLAAGVANEASLVAIAKVSTGSSRLVNNFGGASGAISLSAQSRTTAYTVDTASVIASAAVAGTDADRATKFAMFASTHTQTAATGYWRRGGSGLLLASGTKDSGTMGAASALRIGPGYSADGSGWPGAATIAAVLCYAAALTSEEVEEVHTGMQELLDFYGITDLNE